MFWGIRMNRCLGIVSVMEDGIDTKVQVMMIMRIRGFQALKLREVPTRKMSITMVPSTFSVHDAMSDILLFLRLSST